MEDEISCEIICDLLPNCIENIVSNNTKELVLKHISECDCCRREFENMQKMIDLSDIEERKVDYLKGVKKKCRDILIICVLISIILFIVSICYSSSNVGDVIFVIFLFCLASVSIFIKFALPLFGIVVSALLFKEKKKIWLILICTFFSCWFCYFIYGYICNVIT